VISTCRIPEKLSFRRTTIFCDVFGATTLPITLGSLATKIKLYFIQDLVSECIVETKYLYAIRAVMDLDHGVIRLHRRATMIRHDMYLKMSSCQNVGDRSR
jgi:hypothetical protein